jgi:hypothetical protein
MTGYARATLWIGLILIVLNLLSTGGWSNFWGIITSKGTPAPASGGSAKEAPDPSGTKTLVTPAGAAASKNVTLT